ncbi:uncharacterized protein LOC108625488 isoform X2 [Ceratina calcarata]|uniref:Uncharacterized protein LOC108625488 isoform X2 n=1 Tax=Ceratina calcarata TaxID=156304 RepID=A0AAJ7S2F0_9HYME|nr:uncharacterized protein LOC108625488 isoform X2 [Ceratina calcarata]
MDEYDKKFAEMQKHIPFLEAMIKRLKNVKDKSREANLEKMQSLHEILTDSKRKLKIETLQRCEEVLQRLHDKVGKGNTPGLHYPRKKDDATSTGSSTASEETKNKSKGESKTRPVEDPKSKTAKIKNIHETPASPSPPITPDSTSQTEPIIIPTERKADLYDKVDSKPASPDPVETQATTVPIIIPTERTSGELSPQNSSKSADDMTFSEWDMLEENEKHMTSNKGWPCHDVATAAKIIGSNLPHKSLMTHQVPNSTEMLSILEEERLLDEFTSDSNTDSSHESNEVNVPEARLSSPDSEILFVKHVNKTSPKRKEPLPKPVLKSSVPLLLSPPPVSEPPLSLEDIAELLNEEGGGKVEKKSDRSKEDTSSSKSKNEKQEGNKDPRISKPQLRQDGIDTGSERRWDEVDKHTVKLTTRKCLPSSSSSGKIESTMIGEMKGPSQSNLSHGPGPLTPGTPADNKNLPSASSKLEPRATDNYERHPRHVRDNVDKNVHNINCRPDEQVVIDKNAMHYPRPSTAVSAEVVPDIFNRAPPAPTGQWGTLPVPMNVNTEFPNNQWPTPTNFTGVVTAPPQTYQMMQQDMWNMNTIDPRKINEAQLRLNQFPTNINPVIRPMMTINPNPIDINHIPRPEDADVVPVPSIPPVVLPQRFPVPQPYRNFQGENRTPYEQPFEYSHQRQTWESPSTHRPEGEVPVPCVTEPTDGSSGQFPRTGTPSPWTRGRGSGRSRGTYYHDRGRGNFNRRPEWSRDPRVREHGTVTQNTGQSRDNGSSVRDPRLAKDKHLPATKTKENALNDRDPRKRTLAFIPLKKGNDKTKPASKSTDSHKRGDIENSGKIEKAGKDKQDMQSPLESLYGVIDTKAKSSQGLQKFRIPKIKRPEPLECPISNYVPEDTDTNNKKRNKEDISMEVSSSCDGNILVEDWSGDNNHVVTITKEKNITVEPVENKNESVVTESASISTTSSKSPENAEKLKKDEESEGSKPKEEVTQEWIESLIKKSFEFGEGKKFVEQAKFIQKLGEVLEGKKLKKIKKIIESDSESSSSDKTNTSGTKKVRIKKKRRVIVSDSSDDETRAENIDILNTTTESDVVSQADDKKGEARKRKTSVSGSSNKDPASKDSVTLEQTEVEKNKKSNEDKTNAQETVVETPKVVKKKSTHVSPKTKTKRRNSLEMLQEDVRDMFISDDVVAATGYRHCRSRESSTTANTSTHSNSSLKKGEQGQLDQEYDTEDSSKQKKSAKTTESSKRRGRPKRGGQQSTRSRRSAKRSEYDSTSSSEDDQPLALRIDPIQCNSPSSAQDAKNDDSDALRRSKRINKEILKQPRIVVEKTDISRMDSSKVMFDSSSDESFGIDVSELAAAVDISLHPDKQFEPESAESLAKKKEAGKSGKKSGIESLNETRDDTQFSDVGSVISDISLASSITSGKRAVGLPKIDASANEELLSNILIGLVPSKNDLDKDPLLVDKGSEADVDDDVGDPLRTENIARKSPTKKKKKKWQMGILSKKKKKKTPKSDAELNTSLETDGPNNAEITSILQNAENCDVTQGASVEKPKDNVKNTDNEKISDWHISKRKSKERPSSCVLVESKELTKEGDEELCTPSINEKPKEVEKRKERSIMTKEDKAYNELTLETLNDYFWTIQDRYKCLICAFTGKSIVYHYKVHHPGKEILISRLKSEDARSAIQDAKDSDLKNTCTEPVAEQNSKLQLNCRFCPIFTKGTRKIAMEAFYEHCTTHTGEYRFHCNNCPYKTVAKSSMRTHFYRVCRVGKQSFSESTREDPIPDENCICGYICSVCNYIQLMKSNLERHMDRWHKDDPNAEMIKIDMSHNSTVEEESRDPVDVSEKQLKVEDDSPTLDTIEDIMNTTPTEFIEKEELITTIQTEKGDGINDEEDKKPKMEIPIVKPEEVELPEMEPVPNETKKLLQIETDSNLPSGNLSVFVCPPELEKEEVEIQLERKRKMQEIIENIGIKLQKDASKKDLSIIDKLKDKMKTDEPTTSDNSETNNVVPDSVIETIDTLASIKKTPSEELLAPSAISKTPPPLSEENLDNTQTTDSIIKTETLSPVKSYSQPTSEADTEKLIVKDPLLEPKKNVESEAETSDIENIKVAPPVFDSDSSSEQSDGELSTDVNMILKETSSINASSKDPMLTTIQRLAAQLQATKPLEAKESASPDIDQLKRSRSTDSLPRPPHVVPIASIKNFIGRMENRFNEISNDSNDSDSNQPKNFIRLRRLSGDMLSVPGPSPTSQEDQPLLMNDANQTGTSDKNDTSSQSDVEEECSFLKIENVVSLAPRNDGAESPIINNIRKAVETSPVRSKPVSLLKKTHSPLILKRVNTVNITQPLTKTVQTIVQPTPETIKLIGVKSISPASVTTTQLATGFIPIAPKGKLPVITQGNTRTLAVTPSTQSANVKYKIVKVVPTPSFMKAKESLPAQTNKAKSAEAYNAMLKPAKLVHLYKCMGRNCQFTTDVESYYQQHYLQHASAVEKRKNLLSYDYQKCAYCPVELEDWNQMKSHIDEKHAHCRYQCIYCFYRAVASSYVQIHQTVAHSGHRGILLCKMIKEVPSKEEVNRHDTIHPYVCQHDCGKFFYVFESFVAHLKSKHLSLSCFICHVCRATYVRMPQFLSHYKTHGFFKYQCLYCLHGSDYISEMHCHLSSLHPNRLPEIIERSLPTKAVRNKDVIDQLVVRTLDDSYKTDHIINVESYRNDSNKETSVVNATTSQKIVVLPLPKEMNVLNKETVNDSLSALFGHGNISNSTLNPDISVFETSLNDSTTSAESSVNKTFGSLFNKSDVSTKESVDRSSLDKPPDSISDASSSKVGETLFDCSDEFINTNLLDNPGVLKNGNNDVPAMINSSANLDDSDIEIIDYDNAEIIPPKDIKSELDRADSIDVGDKPKTEVGTDYSSNEQTSSDVKDSNTDFTESKIEAGTSTKTEKPLTLEDIKDTGLTGAALYICGFDCGFSAPTGVLLKSHGKKCSLGGENKSLKCVHCGKRFLKIGFHVEHLKTHGLKRFGCALCKKRCAVGHQAVAHMKQKHKYSCSKLVPADPKNPTADGLFIVQPIIENGERKGKKRKIATKSNEKEPEKPATDSEKLTFSPDEIDVLPRQAIYNREVQCAVCPYTTKVRMNIIRHLQLHAKDESVPESGPVNPVPCLDKKERMFDKMVNLASSSHQNGRMGGKPKESSNKDNDDEFIPKFVPEHKRYVCGVAECNYLTVDEAMLRCHLKALHSEEQYFRCPHCPQPPPGQEGLNIAIDKMGIHLKMHDTRLYKCSHCNHHHYHRHIVERHLSDKHPEKRPFVKVIRESESTEGNQQSVQEEADEEIPDPDGNHWKCNICDYKCVYKAEMVNHASTTHDEKYQYKCNLCTFKGTVKIMFEQHMNSKHSNDPNADYILVYQRIRGINKKNSENVEQSGQDEPFDTTPLWRRDMPRIRHIRGILLEEEGDESVETSPKAKRKCDLDLSTAKPAKIRPGKSSSLDEARQTKESSKRLSLEGENVTDTPDDVDKLKEESVNPIDDYEFNETDVGRYGPYGKADGNMYVCTLCTTFKTKYKHDMRDHLYRELNYARWHCKDCGYLSVNRNALLKHFNKHHNGDRPNHEPLSPDNDIEEWVRTLLKKQTLMIKGLLLKQNAENTALVNAIETDGRKSVITETTQSTVKVSKFENITDKPSTAQSSSTADVADSTDNETRADADSNSPIKMESELNTDSDRTEQSEDQQKMMVCKHCKMEFSRWRGLKLHVQLTHLKRFGYICPYCDRSTNSEGSMRQHIRFKHPGCVEKLQKNPEAGGPELPDEFWQREYGIVFPKRTRKRKKKTVGDVAEKKEKQGPEQSENCSKCNFTAINSTGLKIHMRVHAAKTMLACSYCTFTTLMKAELVEHWDTNHHSLPLKFEEKPLAEHSNKLDDNSTLVDDYSNDIEEEHVVDVKQKELIFYCYYCSFFGKSVDAVQLHWRMMHKETSSPGDVNSKSNTPFRYKEMQMTPGKSILKARTSKAQTESSYELYLQQSQSDIQDIDASSSKEQSWTCQWCNELCDSEVKIKTHHNMYHSHLPLHFRKQDSTKVSRGYACPECSFTTTFINVMKNHISKHISLFKCKHCDKTFTCPTEVSTHNAEEHPNKELKIESIYNFEPLMESLMAKVKWQKIEQNADIEKDLPETPKRKCVAKKSTARNMFRPNIIPHRINAVARKSINPHSRFLAGSSVIAKPEEEKCVQFSFYGVPKTPVDLSKLNTYMVVGGHRMKVNCVTLAQLININPKIVLHDLKHDVQHTATLNTLK